MDTMQEPGDSQSLKPCLCGLTLKSELLRKLDKGQLAVNDEKPAVFISWCSRCIRDWR